MRRHSSHAKYDRSDLGTGHMPVIPDRKDSGPREYKIIGICWNGSSYERVRIRVTADSPPAEINDILNYSDYSNTLTRLGALDANSADALVKVEFREALRNTRTLMQVIAGDGLVVRKVEQVQKLSEPARPLYW